MSCWRWRFCWKATSKESSTISKEPWRFLKDFRASEQQQQQQRRHISRNLGPKNPQSIGKESIFYEAEARGGQLLRASLLKKRSSVPFHSTGKQPLARCDVRAPVTSRTLMTSPSVVIAGVPNHANDPPLFYYYLILFISFKKKKFFFYWRWFWSCVMSHSECW